MALGQVAIVNAALSKLGEDTIESMSQDTAPARLALAVWDNTRQSLLREHPWNFALKIQNLAALAVTPPANFTYQYQLPSDMIRLVSITTGDHARWFDQEYMMYGDAILSNTAGLIIAYVRDVTDTTLWDSKFTDVMVARLAAEMAYSLSKSGSLAEQKLNEYTVTLRKAKHLDSLENPSITLGPEYQADLLAVRY